MTLMLPAHIAGVRRFYDGTEGRRLVTCRDCYRPADEMFGNHGGACRAVGDETRRLRANRKKDR